MKLKIFKETEVRVPRAMLTDLFDLIVTDMARPEWRGSIHLIFSDDHRLHLLNKLFRSKDRPTDVLSFNIDDPVTTDAVFGEIYISVPTAQKQAGEYGLSFAEECCRLACHGYLHLFGLDHQTEEEERRMMTRQEHYLAAVWGRGT